MIRKPETKDRISKDSQFEAERLACWSCWSPCEDSPDRIELQPNKTKTHIQKTEIDPNQRFGREKEIEIFTLAPLFVDGDDLVDEFDVGETTALGFANEFGVATFLYSEEIDVQHFESIIFSAFFVCKLKLWGEEEME